MRTSLYRGFKITQQAHTWHVSGEGIGRLFTEERDAWAFVDQWHAERGD